MPSSITSLDLCSRALTKIDQDPIQSFDEASKAAQTCDILYEAIRDSELSNYFWNFNTKDFELSQEVDTPLNPQWSYQYTLSADHLRTIRAMDINGDDIDFLEEDGKVYANDDRVVLKYLRRIDEAYFPGYFQDCLVARLAYELAEPLVGEKDLNDKSFAEYETKRKFARTVDGQSNPSRKLWGPEQSSWVQSRSGW
jgi:hypothetical protein